MSKTDRVLALTYGEITEHAFAATLGALSSNQEEQAYVWARMLGHYAPLANEYALKVRSCE